MPIDLSSPGTDELDGIVAALGVWQHDESPIQLHPGDLGWHWRHGAGAVADALRIWTVDGQIAAIGFLDGPVTLRLTVAPQLWSERILAERIVADLSDPGRGVLPAGTVSVEAPNGSAVQRLLDESGWRGSESWTPLRHDLSRLPTAGLRVEVIGPVEVSAFTAVHRSAWDSARFTDELWQTMASGEPFGDGRCLLGFDDQDTPVAGITVWSAGPGRPGLIEPLGVHADHRRRGHATQICGAAARELAKLGASSAWVCTESARESAVATYRAAGFRQLPERLDRTRGG